MIVYSSTKTGFTQDTLTGVIDEKIRDSLFEKMGRCTGSGEMRSWQSSLHYMSEVLYDPQIPDDVGVSVEYNIPYTSKRVDMIISGRTEEDRESAVVVELKQWDSVEKVPDKDAIVRTLLGGSVRETAHPSYQAWSYVQLLQDFNRRVQDGRIVLSPCAYLHNYRARESDPLTDGIYTEYLKKAPVFLKHDALKLRDFIKRYIKYGDSGKTIFEIDSGSLRPSKSLQDCLSSMIRGNPEFTMIDEQKVVYESVLHASNTVNTAEDKRTIIVRGGPGTGKSVVAVNLLVELTSRGLACTYVSKNSAPRNVYSAKLKGTLSNSRTDALFRGSGSFTECARDMFDVLIVDEAHRLNSKSGLFGNLGENQVKEIINASRLSVFFIDEDQRVMLKDIGTEEEIRRWAGDLGSSVQDYDLTSQFRCDGSDGYLSWLDDVLQIRETANFDSTHGTGYDVRLFDDPNELRAEIERLNADNRSRMVAGYCWDWISEGKNDPDVCDISIPGTGFRMSWNLGNTGTWAIDPYSVREAGCIHTCQGLEFDYVGVIIGDDMDYRDGAVCTDHTKRARTDQSLRGLHKAHPDREEAERVADRLIRNTYRTLMSRGMKGCYVYCTRPGLGEYLGRRIEGFRDRGV